MTKRSHGRKEPDSRKSAPLLEPEPAESAPAGFHRTGWRGKSAILLAGMAILGLLGYVFAGPLVRGGDELSLAYPFEGSVFPPEIIAPVVWWDDQDPLADRWRVTIRFADSGAEFMVDVDTTVWSPAADVWENIKQRSLESPARLTVERMRSVLGVRFASASDDVQFSTSSDSVGAPIFYRDVPLPFKFALRNVPLIKWRLGNIASYEPPPTALTNLPVCGNCHSFSSDGTLLGMDVDLGSDKGAYALTPFEPTTRLSKDRLISWSDFVRGDSVPTFGFLPRVSPDGRYVLAGVKDRAVFLPREDMLFSQIFFPVMGILAYYDRAADRIEALPGADDENLVQTNGVWSPDGQTVIFARAEAAQLTGEHRSDDIVLTLEESAEVLGGEEHLWSAQEGGNRFRFDLYRLPFNEGAGGEPVPIPGASNNGMSNYFPKVSPNGKWIVFTQAHSFMLLQPDSKLYIMPVEGGEPRQMNANTSRMNSWHSWSPNSKWLVFSTKVFGPYTQLMLTHIDEDGNDSPPVLLHNFTDEYRAANIPEFVNIAPNSDRVIEEQFIDDYSYFRSGRIYQQFHEFDRAVEEFEKSLALNPDNTFSLYSLASIYREQQDYEEARKAYEAVLERDPGSATVHAEFGSFCFEMEEYEKAEAEFLTALRLDPGHFEAGFNLGVVYLTQQKLADAEQAFRRLLARELDPENVVDVRERLAATQILKGDYEQATIALETLIESDGENTNARYNLGLAYLSMNRAPEARAQFEAVVRIDSTHALAYAQLGEMHARAGDAETALYYFQRLVAVDSSSIEGHRQIARLHIEQQDVEAAQAALASVLRLDPTDAWANWNLGMVHYEVGRYDLAARQFRMIADSRPGDARVWFVLGETLVREGRSVPEAIEAFEKGLALDPSDIDGHVALGDLYIRVGDDAAALRAFEAALAAGPNEPGLADMLGPRIDDLRRRIR